MYISPCISVCKIDKETRVCEGCGRTIDEIRLWTKYSEEERMEVMRRLGYGKRKERRSSKS
jgi:predicted Fe-S protein YdhL (DUF1289 family)